MNLAALLAAPDWVIVHALAALAALGLGLVQLLAPKGTRPHRALGYLWVALMAVVVASSFLMIADCGAEGLGPIHALSVVTALGLVGLVRKARAGDVRAHRTDALWLFGAALVGAGLFTLLPGRLMHDVAFGTQAVRYDCG